ncbi:MAG: hypothetical protein ACJA08_003343 [Cyclobacteriaceae bacterium]|jgi:hypothetical protein
MRKLIQISYVAAAWLICLSILNSCIEKIDFKVPAADLQLVVDGMITDDLGPYTVKLSQGLSLNIDSVILVPVEKAIITLFDDEGNKESFTESTSGIYTTAGNIQGQIGHAYHIRIETEEGKIFESDPEMIHPVGSVDAIKYEFEARNIEKYYGLVAADVFNIYVDAHSLETEENYVRWRFKGTYKATTNPELHMTISTVYTPYKSPLPCSGYIVIAFVPGGKLEKVEECTCCTCWVNDFESAPSLSDVELVSGGIFRNVKVGEIPINVSTFHEKYLVEVEQMSLTSSTYEFFKLIRNQKLQAASLFQPPGGVIIGNLHAVNNDDTVIGLFWATSITKKSLFIQRSEVPYPLTDKTIVTDECTNYYPNSFNEKPSSWD